MVPKAPDLHICLSNFMGLSVKDGVVRMFHIEKNTPGRLGWPVPPPRRVRIAPERPHPDAVGMGQTHCTPAGIVASF
ncbi:hypothetical protein AOLI_G00170960 [Acnodon oligacanthus]